MAKTLLPQDQLHIDTCVRFCSEVESLVLQSNKKADERELTTGKKTLRLSYVDAVLAVAERWNIAPDLAAAYLNPEIKQKMQFEWESKNMISKVAKLPF